MKGNKVPHSRPCTVDLCWVMPPMAGLRKLRCSDDQPSEGRHWADHAGRGENVWLDRCVAAKVSKEPKAVSGGLSIGALDGKMTGFVCVHLRPLVTACLSTRKCGAGPVLRTMRHHISHEQFAVLRDRSAPQHGSYGTGMAPAVFRQQ